MLMNKKILALAALLLTTFSAVADTNPSLTSGDMTLTFLPSGTGYTWQCSSGSATFLPQDGKTVVAEVFAASSDAATFYASAYDSISTATEGRIVAYATLKTAAGSELLFTDTWLVQPSRQSLRLQRVV